MKNSKGFVLVEAIFMLVFLAVGLILVYRAFLSAFQTEKIRAQFDNIEDIYKVSIISKYFEENYIDEFINNSTFTNGYLEIACDNTYLINREFCIFITNSDNFDIKKMYITRYDAEGINHALLDPTTSLYFKSISAEGEFYRLTVQFNNDKYASIKINLPISYTLAVLVNGGTWSGQTPQILTSGREVDIAEPTKPNFIFGGWELAGENATFNDTTLKFTMGTSNASLTAMWVGPADQLNDFYYNNSLTNGQEFVADYNGYYKVEVWGAAGAGNSYGGYSSGIIFLQKDTRMYAYVGSTAGSGSEGAGYNGGGAGAYECLNYGSRAVAGGSGASDVRLVNGVWSNAVSLRSRIIVAGGGGSKKSRGNIGYAGGLSGYSADDACPGGAQSPGGTFGQGQAAQGGYNADAYDGYVATAGAGGGYYGGRTCGVVDYGGMNGSGGSSYISGHTGCVAIISASNSNPKPGCSLGTVYNDCSIHYSGFAFSNTLMIDGAGKKWTTGIGAAEPMPNPSGGFYATNTGNNGHGHVRITFLGRTLP